MPCRFWSAARLLSSTVLIGCPRAAFTCEAHFSQHPQPGSRYMTAWVARAGVDTSAKARTIFLIIHSFQQKSAERPYQPSAPVAHLRSIPPTSWPSWASALSALSLQQVIFPCSSFLQQQHSFVGAGAASAANAAEDMVSASAPKRYLFVMILLRSIVENCSAMPRAAGALEEQ